MWIPYLFYILEKIKGILPEPELCGYALLNFISAKFFRAHKMRNFNGVKLKPVKK